MLSEIPNKNTMATNAFELPIRSDRYMQLYVRIYPVLKFIHTYMHNHTLIVYILYKLFSYVRILYLLAYS